MSWAQSRHIPRALALAPVLLSELMIQLDDLQPNEITPTPLRSRIRYLDGIVRSGAAGPAREVQIKIEPTDGDGPDGIKVEVRPVDTADGLETAGTAEVGADVVMKDQAGAGSRLGSGSGDEETAVKEETMEVDPKGAKEDRRERATSPVAP